MSGINELRGVACITCGMLAVMLLAAVAGGEPVDPAMLEKVRALTAEMSATDAATRNRASARLRNLSVEAFPAVEALLKDDNLDPETIARLRAFQKAMRAPHAIYERRKQEREWDLKTALDSYDTVGVQDPNWTPAVREAIRLSIEADWSNQQSPQLRATLEQVKKTGCYDPLFLALYSALASHGNDAEWKSWLEMLHEAAEDMQASDYPPERKCVAIARYAWAFGGASATVKGSLDRAYSWRKEPHISGAIAELKKAGVAGRVPPGIVYRIVSLIAEADRRGTFGTAMSTRDLSQILDKAAQGTVYPLLFRAEQGLLDGTSVIFAMNEEGKMVRRANGYDVARECCQKAYELDPDDPQAPLLMLRPELLRGKQRDHVELWFKRAMQADPDNMEACRRKLAYLSANEPEAALAFARQCRETENWRGKLPFLLVDVHYQLASSAPERMTYLQQSSVWADIKQVYGPYLELYPEDARIRSNFARWASLCRHWPEADRQFNLLGEQHDASVFGGEASYAYARKKAARLAAMAP